MRKILDKIFKNKKLAFVIPIAMALLVYLLFVLFGTAVDKKNVMILTPIISVFWFFGVFLLMYIQVKNPMCPDRYLDFFELLFMVLLGIFSIVGTISFLVSGFENFNIGICLAFVSCAAISWAHSKRTK